MLGIVSSSCYSWQIDSKTSCHACEDLDVICGVVESNLCADVENKVFIQWIGQPAAEESLIIGLTFGADDAKIIDIRTQRSNHIESQHPLVGNPDIVVAFIIINRIEFHLPAQSLDFGHVPSDLENKSTLDVCVYRVGSRGAFHKWHGAGSSVRSLV